MYDQKDMFLFLILILDIGKGIIMEVTEQLKTVYSCKNRC